MIVKPKSIEDDIAPSRRIGIQPTTSARMCAWRLKLNKKEERVKRIRRRLQERKKYVVEANRTMYL
jgi:division protein CdvB (Snf7/Vps24/ESCRT-III family)